MNMDQKQEGKYSFNFQVREIRVMLTLCKRGEYTLLLLRGKSQLISVLLKGLNFLESKKQEVSKTEFVQGKNSTQHNSSVVAPPIQGFVYTSCYKNHSNRCFTCNLQIKNNVTFGQLNGGSGVHREGLPFFVTYLQFYTENLQFSTKIFLKICI